MDNKKQIFVLVHGSWHGGWCWEKVEKSLLERGHQVVSPTLLGMTSKNDPNAKKAGLLKHVDQIVEMISPNNFDSVILVGHSYAGMVITGVANKIPENISKLVYLDAFLPDHNQSLFDISLPERVKVMIDSLVDSSGKTLVDGAEEVWLLPVRDPATFGVTQVDDVLYLKEKMVPTPILTFQEKVLADNPKALSIPKYYIRCLDCPLMERFENKAKNLGYCVYSIKSGHDAMITNPGELSDLLVEIGNH